MNKYILIVVTIVLSACGFNSNDESSSSDDVESIIALKDSDDSDGDLISNGKEKDLGRNSLVAEIPDVRVRFLQNYKIIGLAKEVETDKTHEFVIDTKVRRDDPDFKYRVGGILMRDQAYREAARIGRFSSHSYGSITEEDFTLVKYPEVDTRFYMQKVLEYKKYFDKDKYKIQNIQIELESSVKLEDNRHFEMIKDFSVNFYFYNYEQESYEKIKTHVFKKNFSAGVNENITLVIENAPIRLLEENYFKKGEFIISEINDFEIPSLDTTYKTLMRSVRSKSIPVILNTPLETKVSYVGLQNGKTSLAKIFTRLWGDDYTIKNNELDKIGQFSNNLPAFQHLSELGEFSKKGKWFTFTNKINRPLLDYEFKNGDYITLSYILGKELVNQLDENVHHIRAKASTGELGSGHPLGNLTASSLIELQLRPLNVKGDKIKHWREKFNNTTVEGYRCYIDFNIFSTIDEQLILKDDPYGAYSRIILDINHEEFSLKKLVDDKKVTAEWIGDNLHIKIDDITKIKELDPVKESFIMLTLLAANEKTYQGVKLSEYRGILSSSCLDRVMRRAYDNNYPISTSSYQFSQTFENMANWNVLRRASDRDYKQEFSLGFSSIIKNFYN
jgi:hypothetical protein